MQIKSIVAVAAIAFLTSMGAVSAAEMSILEGITAEPLTLTDTQMDTVTAGAGLKVKNPNAPAPDGGIPPWIKLFDLGFDADDTLVTGLSGVVVLLPR